MKTSVISICMMLFAISLFAQVQQGNVKTLGRPDKSGVALGGVTLRVKGEQNAVLSGDDGKFSFQFTGKTLGEAYTLQQVRKTGYELNDQGMIGRRLAYSDKVPLTIVMVSTAQLEEDKRRIENNAYKVAEKNYKNKLALLEKQLGDGTVTEEKYRKELGELQDKFGKFQSLINDLADHYAHTDYDMLNEKEREINICIENGELERADSLLHLIFNPEGVLERNVAAFSHIEKSEREGRNILDQANADMAKVLRQQEKDAEYLYQLYTIALSRFDNEKARFYIETRAELDTTNVEWQIQAGEFIEVFLADYEKALEYFHNTLKLSNISTRERIVCQTDIGSIKEQQGKYTEALQIFKETLKLAEENGLKCTSAILYNNIGNTCRHLEDYAKAIKNIDTAIKIWETITEEEIKEEKIKFSKYVYLTIGHTTIANAYDFNNQNKEALSHIEKALKICKEHCSDMPEKMAGIYSTYANICNTQKDYAKAITCHKEALQLYIKVYGESHPFVGIVYFNIADNYGMMDDYDMALEYLQKSIRIKERCYGEKHPSTAHSYGTLGIVYFMKGDKVKSLELLNHALDIYKETVGENHSTTKDIQNAIDEIKSAM